MDVVPYLYLIALVVSIAGLGLLDIRHDLALKRYPLPTLLSVGIGVIVMCLPSGTAC